MIAAVIRWSAHNVFLIGLATVFVTLAGIYAVSRVPLDAIPDLSDVQVIVYTEYSGQAPQVVEDQVTYPLTTAMLSVPKSRVVRGFSFFGVSFVYVIFEDGTDLYWARSRVLEYLSSAARRLPAGVAPSLGPDATGVGWVYQYVVRGAQKSLAELRTIQDWYVRYGIAKAEGVAEVASVGGFVKQYSVVIDPRRLQALGIPLAKIREALRSSNMDVGGRTVELAETEFAVRGRGYIKGLSDLEQIVVKDERGVPVLLKDVAQVELTPDERRGITEMDGEGEVVSGIALQRFGENALAVIRNVKDRLAEIAPSLPRGVTIEAVYDRSDLIYRAIDTLKRTLIEESLIVALVCVIFLLHVRSALVAIITLPLGVLIAYLCMHLLGLSSNIMSLGGIAIAIGAMVDAAIVMIENAHKHLERAPPDQPRAEVLVKAALEVGPALFFSLLIITVSFLPIFALEAQEGRLFKPLANTKTFAMAAAALLSITLVPALMILFVRGRIVPEHRNPVNRFLIWIYRPVIRLALRFKAATILIALLILAGSVWPALRLGTEFHAQPQRGHAVLHADHAAGAVGDQGRGAGADPGQDHQVVPRGGLGLGQGRARRHRHRSRPHRDVRDRDQPQAGQRMAARHDARQADRGDGQGAAISRRFQRVDHADQSPHRHALDRHPHAGRGQGAGHRPRRDGEARAPDRGRDPDRAGDHQRLRRAGDRRLLPQYRPRPRPARPLRPHGRRPAEPDRHGARRRAGHDHG
jgi:copper/silver efflux system protein